jgi:hypothetical protein
MQSKKVIQDLENKKAFATDRQKTKIISPLDLKKVSPYLARNQKIELAKKVVELEQEYKQTKALYAISAGKDNDDMLAPQRPKEVK